MERACVRTAFDMQMNGSLNSLHRYGPGSDGCMVYALAYDAIAECCHRNPLEKKWLCEHNSKLLCDIVVIVRIIHVCIVHACDSGDGFM